MKRIIVSSLFLLFLSVLSFAGNKSKLMWIDCSANFERLSYPDSIYYYVDKCHEIGITHLILDLKGTSGGVLYPSKIAPQKKEWKGFSRPDFDFVNTFIRAAHEKNMKIFASFNIFVDGHGIFKIGEIYGKHKKWQAHNYYPDKGIVGVTEIESATKFLNPALKEVQEYELSILKEVVKNYKFDGIMLDRTRYDRIESDFSEQSKKMFERYIGNKVGEFPKDIYEWKINNDGKSYRREPGKYYKQWIEWRASVIYGFFKEARKQIKKINPDCVFAAYTGAWYPSYYEVGVNWASKKYDPSIDFDWATPNYKNYGYAELLDLYTNGNYFWNVTLDEYYKSSGKHRNETDSGFSTGEHLCVEGGCKLTRKLLMDAVPFCGGMYVEDYKQDVNQFKRAAIMNLKESDGLMVFDMVHIINRNWWNALKEAIDEGDK